MKTDKAALETRARLAASLPIKEFYEPPLGISPEELIADVEESLGVEMPPWLREIYWACNGFVDRTNDTLVFQLDGTGGVWDFTDAIRRQDWAPPWLGRAMLFGILSGSGSSTVHCAALDGRLIEWAYQDGEAYTVVEGDDVFEMLRRHHAGVRAMLEEIGAWDDGDEASP